MMMMMMIYDDDDDEIWQDDPSWKWEHFMV